MRGFFPEASYLHLVREPAAVCRSYFRFRERLQSLAGGRGRQGPRLVDLDEPDQVWLAPHRRILRHLEQVPAARCLRVRAEDVLADPAAQLGRIAEWLGLPHGPEEIDAMLHPENSPYAGPGPSAARFGNDPEFLRSPALRAPSTRKPDSGDDFTLSDATRALAAQLGYPG